MSAGGAPSEDSHGRVIAFVKSVGGVGATALATQMGCLLAARESVAGRETCLLDLDLQFGNAALYLGLSPTLSVADVIARSEEHTSELQSLMRISYAVFCLKKKTIT